jgi:cytochrome c
MRRLPHSRGRPNRVGPNLFGVVERPPAAGFNYSAAMKAKGGRTYDDLNKHANPRLCTGNAMGFAGIPKDSERADAIDYLHTLADSPVPLPTAAK